MAALPPGPRGRSRLREAKKQEVQRAIVSAAMALFEERGFDAATMDEIAVQANVSRPTVFNYFACKEAILPIAFNQMMIDRLDDELALTNSGGIEQPIEAMRAAIVAIGEAFASNPETARAFFVHHMQAGRQRRHPPRGRARAGDCPFPEDGATGQEPHNPGLELRERLMERMAVLLARAQALGQVRRDFEPAELVRLVFVGLFAATIGPWLWGRLGDRPLSEVVSRHFEFFLDGLSGPDGA